MSYQITVFWDEWSSQYVKENGVEEALKLQESNPDADIICDWCVSHYNFDTIEEVRAFRMAIAEAQVYSASEIIMVNTKEL